MTGTIGHTSHLIDFFTDDFDFKRIEESLKSLIYSYLNTYDISELAEWELLFTLINGNRDKIYVYRKTRSDIWMKYKEILIHIPIPLTSQIKWGVEEKQVVKINYLKDNKYSESIEPAIDGHSNVYDFIIDCAEKGIKHAFS